MQRNGSLGEDGGNEDHGRRLAHGLVLLGLMLGLAACGGGGETTVAASPAPNPAPAPAPAPAPDPTPAPAPAPAPAPSSPVTLTVVLEAPATVQPGTLWMRTGTTAVTRADITALDAQCSPSGPGSKTCTFNNIPRGQTVTLVATDSGAEVAFVWQPIVSLRDADPRGIRSQFIDFDGACTTPERGVCVITASDDQTVRVRSAPLKLTKLRFVGNVNWSVSVTARATLNVAGDLNTDIQGKFFWPATPGVGECVTDPAAAVTCYQIMSTNDSVIKFEALPPDGPAPLGSFGPLRFVRFDNACNDSEGCVVTSDVDETITMSWQYYKCATQSLNTRWNFGPTETGPLGEVCPLTTP